DLSSSIPAGETGSAIRIFIRMMWRPDIPGPYRLCSCELGHRRFHVDLFDGAYARAEFHRVAVGVQNDFQARYDCEQIGEIEIAEMCDAENLPLHRALAVGDDRAEPIAEFLDDDARIEALRRAHGGHRRAWRLWSE